MKAFLNYIIEKVDIDAIIIFFEKIRRGFVKWKKAPRKFLTFCILPFSYVCAGVSSFLLNLIWAYWFIRYFIFRADKYSLSATASDAGRDYKLQFIPLFVRNDLCVRAVNPCDPTEIVYDTLVYKPFAFGLAIIFINLLVIYFVYLYYHHIRQLEEDQYFLILLIFGLFGLFISWISLGCLLTILDGILTHSFFNFTTDDYTQAELVFEPYLISKFIKLKVTRLYTIPDLYQYVFLRHATECLEAHAPEGLFDYKRDEIIERFKQCFPYDFVMDQGRYKPANSDDLAFRKRSAVPTTLLEYTTPGWQFNHHKDIGPYYRYYPEHAPNAFDKFTVDNVLRAAEEAVSSFVTEDQEYNVMCRDHFTTPFQQTCRAWAAAWISMKYALAYYQKSWFNRFIFRGKLIRTVLSMPSIIKVWQGYSYNWYPVSLLALWFNMDADLWRLHYGERKRTWGETPQGRKYNRYYYSSEWWGEKYMYEFVKNKKGKWVRGPRKPYKEAYHYNYDSYRHYAGNYYDWRHW